MMNKACERCDLWNYPVTLASEFTDGRKLIAGRPVKPVLKVCGEEIAPRFQRNASNPSNKAGRK
jgi:hypothetical protein